MNAPTCSDVVAPPRAGDAAWLLVSACLAAGAPVPRVVWCTPETPDEAGYVARWGARDWRAAPVQLAHHDIAAGDLWLRADRIDDLTPAIFADLFTRHN